MISIDPFCSDGCSVCHGPELALAISQVAAKEIKDEA